APPRSAPLPYTTLFRSAGLLADLEGLVGQQLHQGAGLLDGGRVRPLFGQIGEQGRAVRLDAGPGQGPLLLVADRAVVDEEERLRSEEHTSELQSRENLV